MSEYSLPKPPRREPDRSYRPWGAKYSLIYDGGGMSTWTQYYHTKWGAIFSAFMHYHIRSWGGSAEVFDNRRRTSGQM